MLKRLSLKKLSLVHKKIAYLENYQSRSIVTNTSLESWMHFTVQKDGDVAYVNYLMVQNGSIMQTKTIKVEAQLDETS